jgi:acyl-coenzyme A synthetase/AMP-(fatty) acid ligase
MNLSPALIEKVVSEIEGIDECAAFGALNSQKEESVILAYSLLKGLNELNIEEIIHKSVLGALGKNYMIDKFYNVVSIPKNINGKIDKIVLKAKWLEENADKV